MFFIILYTSIIIGSVAIDQITKLLAQNGKSFKVIGSLLKVNYVENRGMAYGMLGDWKYAQTFFIVLTIILLVVALIFLVKTKNRSKCFHISLALVIGGAMGNFIDRVALNYVRDFIELDLKIAFLQFNCNPADVFITAGAIMFVIYFLFVDKEAIFKINKREEK